MKFIICICCIFTSVIGNLFALEVTNFRNGEEVRYPLVMLRGDTGGDQKSVLAVLNRSSRMDSRKMSGLVSDGRFKVFAELVPGKNTLELRHSGESKRLTLLYKPQTNSYKVRAVFYTDNTGDTTYESQLKGPQNYHAKWDASMKLLQCFTAEWMHRNGYGRRTFNLELNDEGMVKVNIVKSAKSFEELQSVKGRQTFQMVYRDINSQLAKDSHKFKNLVQLAWSRHNKETGMASGYAALGGGGVALMGGACFYTWPSGVQNIQSTFMSDVQIDARNFHADGGNAIFRTAGNTLGAGLHELGHAFGLPHTNSKAGMGNALMFHGYLMNRYATFASPPWDGNGHKWRSFDEEKEFKSIYIAPVSAAALAPTRYFAMDDREYTKENSIEIKLDEAKQEVVVTSNDGLAFVSAEIPGAAEKYKKFSRDRARKEFRMPIKVLEEGYGTSDLTIRVVDWMGHLKQTNLKKMIEAG